MKEIPMIKGISAELCLNDRLILLKDIFEIDRDIDIVYLSGEEDEKGCRGEVQGDTIFVYDTELGDALDTLDHEFLEIVHRPFNNMVMRLMDSNLSLTTSLFKAFMESHQSHLQNMFYEIEEARLETVKQGLPKPKNIVRDQ